MTFSYKTERSIALSNYHTALNVGRRHAVQVARRVAPSGSRQIAPE